MRGGAEIAFGRLAYIWLSVGEWLWWGLGVIAAIAALVFAGKFFHAAAKRLYAFARPRWLVFLSGGIAAQVGIAATLYSVGFVGAAISVSVVFAAAIILLLK